MGGSLQQLLNRVPQVHLSDLKKGDVIMLVASGDDGHVNLITLLSGVEPLLEAPALIAVGAAFNFHAGEVRQAPRWMMRSGLEWLFRLCMEPRRLWRRYLIGNPLFLARICRERMYVKRPKPEL